MVSRGSSQPREGNSKGLQQNKYREIVVAKIATEREIELAMMARNWIG